MNEDINRPATYGGLHLLKIDVHKLDQRFQGLDQKVERLAIDHAKLRGDVFDMKDEILLAIRETKNEILGAVVKFHDDTVMIDRRELLLKDRVDKLEDRVRSMEER